MQSIKSIAVVQTTRLPRAAATMIGVKSDPDKPEAVVVCRFGHVNVLFGAVEDEVGSVVFAL